MFPHSDAIVIGALIGPANVGRILIDTGSACDILFLSIIKHMKLENAEMIACPGPIVGFTGASMPIHGVITLPISLGTEPYIVRHLCKFCHYHNMTGHQTEECIQLMKDIERLIRGGHLMQFVGAPKQSRRKEVPPAMAHVVAYDPPTGGFLDLNMIVGGPSAGGSTSSAQRG